MTPLTDWRVVGPLCAAMVGLYGWFLVHVTRGNRHPKSDDLVYGDVCTERGKSNDQAHTHLQKGIEDAIKKSDEQHKELKADMRIGFGEIKTLIQAK